MFKRFSKAGFYQSARRAYSTNHQKPSTFSRLNSFIDNNKTVLFGLVLGAATYQLFELKKELLDVKVEFTKEQLRARKLELEFLDKQTKQIINTAHETAEQHLMKISYSLGRMYEMIVIDEMQSRVYGREKRQHDSEWLNLVGKPTTTTVHFEKDVNSEKVRFVSNEFSALNHTWRCVLTPTEVPNICHTQLEVVDSEFNSSTTNLRVTLKAKDLLQESGVYSLYPGQADSDVIEISDSLKQSEDVQQRESFDTEVVLTILHPSWFPSVESMNRCRELFNQSAYLREYLSKASLKAKLESRARAKKSE